MAVQAAERSAGGIDVEGDLPLRALGLQVQQLGHHDVGHTVVDLGPQEDDALGQQPRVDVERALAVRGPLDDRGDRVLAHARNPASCSTAAGRTSATCPTTWSISPYARASSASNPPVPPAVPLDGLRGLAGVLGREAGEHRADAVELADVDLDIRGRAAEAGRALVHQHLGVRQAEPLAGRAGGQQELAHAAGQTHSQRTDVVGDQPHRVVDGQAGADRSARGVDVQADVRARVLRREQQQLGAQPIGDGIVDPPCRAR